MYLNYKNINTYMYYSYFKNFITIIKKDIKKKNLYLKMLNEKIVNYKYYA